MAGAFLRGRGIPRINTPCSASTTSILADAVWCTRPTSRVGVGSPKGRTREREFSPEQIHEIFGRMPLAEPAMPLVGVYNYEDAASVLEDFTFEPGYFTRNYP